MLLDKNQAHAGVFNLISPHFYYISYSMLHVDLYLNFLFHVSWRYFAEGNGNPLQYSCLKNSMDGGAWWAVVHGVAESWAWLIDFTFTHWRRQWQPTPVLSPGKFHGRTSLAGCSFRGRCSSWDR